MARIVPNNPFAFPPSLEVRAGGRVKQEARTEEQLSVNPNIALPLNVGHRASDAQSTRSFLK